MFTEVFRFEIRRSFLTPAIYIYWFVLFALSFGIVNVAGGAFKTINIAFAGDNVNINSPAIIDILLGYFSYFGIFIVAAICSNIVFKDFKFNSLELTFTTPLNKFQYIFGRFAAAFILSIFVFTGVAIGFYIGTFMPYINQNLFGPNEFMSYVYPYLTKVIPNLFFICSIFFSLSLLLRNAVINWISIIALYILYGISSSIFSDLDNQNIASLLDPFGLNAAVKVTSTNSASDMNEKGAILEGIFFFNRLLWASISLCILIFTYFRFKMSYNLRSYNIFSNKKQKNIQTEKENRNAKNNQFDKLRLPKVSKSIKQWNIFKSLLGFELKKLFKSPYFILINLICLIFLFTAAQGTGRMYDTTTYPVTYLLIDILKRSINLFIFIAIVIFSGEMIWRDRDLNIHEITNTQPLSRWSSLLSKFITLNIGIAFMQLLIIACGLITQSLDHYYNFELNLYFTSIFGIDFISYGLTIALAFFVHIIVNQKYAGYLILILYKILNGFIGSQLIQHKLLNYGSSTGTFYSDMNKFGFDLIPYYIFKFYWVLVAAIMLIIVNQLIVTQTDNSFKSRWKAFKLNIKGKNSIAIVVLGFITLGYAGFIYYNTDIKNERHSPYESELSAVNYEKTYKRFETKAQPKITDIKLNVDLYPSKGDVKAKGTYFLKNNSNEAIDTLFVQSNLGKTTFKLNKKVEWKKEDKDQNVTLIKFERSIQPNEKIELNFTYTAINDGFDHYGAKNACEKNGTFMYNSSFPSIGYNNGLEISGTRIRKKHNLPDRDIVKNIDDSTGIKTNFISRDADFINYEATISTDSDQTAVTPGELISSWKENNRNYFHYKSEQPMLNYYAILSGAYKKKTEIWSPNDSSDQKVEISILYHPQHEYNLNNMMKGVKLSLDNYNANYSKYQFKQLRIVEFPRFSSYAQSFPNMIPFSEGIGFIADLRELNDNSVDFEDLKIDYPFYVTAHEMAHQWWAHQVVAADVEGYQMLMESITQFSALKTMEKEYGKDRMKKFLQNENFRYLISRNSEGHEERPLGRVAPHQSTTYYNKGSLVMYGLDNYLGENKLMPILSNFLKKHAFQGAPYPTTTELIEDIKENTPDSLKYYIDDAFNKITFYKTSIDSATYKRNPDFTYTIKAKVNMQKFYADGNGKETETPCNDYVELGVYNSSGKTIEMKRLKLNTGDQFISFTVPRKPNKITVDPNYSLITKNWERDGLIVNKEKKKAKKEIAEN
ncbi:MAG: M1 family aminopeptidase [Bacteroidales bacterium]